MNRHKDKSEQKAGTEVVVFSVRKDTKCAECGCELWKGNFLRLDQEKALSCDKGGRLRGRL